MERQDIHKQIQQLSEKISRLNNNLKEDTTLHEVEIELLMGYTNELDRLASLLGNVAAGDATTEVELPVKVADEVKEDMPPEDIVEEVAEEEEEPEADIEMAETKANDIEEAPEPVIEEEAHEDTSNDYDVEEEKESDDKELSLNDRFKHQTSDLASKLNSRPSESLRNMIDLSEKYEFINELFEGDGTFFDRTLRQLDKCQSYDEAMEYLDTEVKYQVIWEGKEKYEEKLLDLLSRRFADVLK